MDFPLDRYVVNTLLRDLVGHDRSPSAFLVCLLLYRRTAGEGRETVHLSHQQIADATGLSKSAVQRAVRALDRRALVRARCTSPTARPAYAIERPWRRQQAGP